MTSRQGMGLFATSHLRPAPLPGVKRLMLAILEDAMGLLGRSSEGEEREREEAIAWFLSRARGLFAFEDICEHLDLNANAVRRAVLSRGNIFNRKSQRFRPVVCGRNTRPTAGTLYFRNNRTINAQPRRKEFAT